MATGKTNKTVIIIAGPTAVGKTKVAIEIAKHFNTEIISADSRQCYKELNIGVARPTPRELAEVKHHFIASYSIHEEINAAIFEKFALQKASELFRDHDVVVMVGGTGLYIKAFTDGLDAIPAVSEETRTKIIAGYEQNGIGWLQERIEQKDPAFYGAGEIQNPQRLMRALEVIETTGRSILDFRKGKRSGRDFNIIKFGLELPKEKLHENIKQRVDRMMVDGLLEEVKDLLHLRQVNALQTVGYSELFDHLNNRRTITGAVEEIKKNTRQYAKRQMTWFRKDKDIIWFSPDDKESMLESISGID